MSTNARRIRSKRALPVPTAMTAHDLAHLGDGTVGYIRIMTSDEARQLYPSIEGLPHGIQLFALHGADGTPIALTDSRQSALGHAVDVELTVSSVH